MNTPRPTMRPQTRTGRRRAAWIGACCAALLTASVLTAPAAMAADGPYTIDGVVPDANTTELADQTGNVKELGPLNSNTTKIGVIHADAVPTLGMTNPNGQVDLRRAWLDTERDTSTQHDWLYFAWERDNNSGSGFIAYEFMQNPVPAGCAYATATDADLIANCNPWDNRTAGDFMILWDQQGGSLDLFLRTWSGSGDNLTLSAPTQLNAAVSQAAYSADGFRGEAAVDLTATIFAGSTACRSFANTIPSTVTGNSDTADYKDTILKTAPPITNCTPTIVTTPKQADGTTNIPAGGLSYAAASAGVKDSALINVTGGTATPSGSVTFYLCQVASGACTTGGTLVGSAVPLTGAAYPVTVVSGLAPITSPGRYCWRAEFSGDAANGIAAVSDASLNECFVVNAVPSSLTSAQNWVPNDSVTITAPAGGALAGTVAFALYAGTTCQGAALYSTTAPVAGTSPQTVYTANTTTVVATATGSYSWKVSYDSTNPAQLDIGNKCHENSSVTITNGAAQTGP